MADCVDEGIQVFNAAKMKFDSTEQIKVSFSILTKILPLPNFIYNLLTRGKIPKVDEHAKTSMLQMIEKGKKTEIDFLNGEISRLGKEYNIKTPVNDKIIQLVKNAEKLGKSPKYTPAELYEQVYGRKPGNMSIIVPLIILAICIIYYYMK